MNDVKILVKVGKSAIMGGAPFGFMIFLVEDFSKFKNTILVHGGSSELNNISSKLDYPPNFIESDNGMSTLAKVYRQKNYEYFQYGLCGKKEFLK